MTLARPGPLLAVACTSLFAWGDPGPATAPKALPTRSQVVLVRGGTLWTVGAQGTLPKGDLLVRGGKIVAVGRDLPVPEGAMVVEASSRHVTPGLIDAHSHSAIRGVNETGKGVTAEVRIEDVIDPDSEEIDRQLAGGLTTAHLMHGSANTIGGQNATVKWKRGATREELLIPTAEPTIKFALGENPKRSAGYPRTRMGVQALIRERFLAALDYQRDWAAYERLDDAGKARREPPRRDLELEALAEVLHGTRKIHCHCYRQDEILALIRAAEEFGVKVGSFHHALEGYKVAREIADHGAGAATFSDWWAYKMEAYDAIPYNGLILTRRGVLTSFKSDSGELARRMNLEAAKGVKYGGLTEEESLRLVTLNPARQLGIADRVGSLEPGKDADFVIWSSHPLSVYAVAEQTWVDGVKQFDRREDFEVRVAVEREREALIRKIRGSEGGEEAESVVPAAAAASAIAPRPVLKLSPPVYRDRSAALRGRFAVSGATIHTLAGTPIVNGTVVVDRGRIVAVGPGLTPPPGTAIVDGRGKHLYPGFIHLHTTLGRTEVGSVSACVDHGEEGHLHPEVQVDLAVNPDSELLPVTRANGITHALTVPTGATIGGTSAFIRLAGWTWEDLVAASPVAMHLRWPSFRIRRPRRPSEEVPSEEEQKKALAGELRAIRDAFAHARAYLKAKEAQSREPSRTFRADPSWDAMIPVLEGKIPIVVHADELAQIRSAIAWARQEEVRIVLAAAGDVWRAADLLREHGIPVIVTGILARPRREDEPYDTAFTIPRRLHEAGVSYCVAGSLDAANARNLPYHAAMAAAFGLPKEEALKAVTLYPAQVLGLDRDLGTIEPGKSASFILTDGDPLEIRTNVISVFIDGQPVDPSDNKQHRLYRKYGARPDSPAPAPAPAVK